jgi:hypothetical protein
MIGHRILICRYKFQVTWHQLQNAEYCQALRISGLVTCNLEPVTGSSTQHAMFINKCTLKPISKLHLQPKVTHKTINVYAEL